MATNLKYDNVALALATAKTLQGRAKNHKGARHKLHDAEEKLSAAQDRISGTETGCAVRENDGRVQQLLKDANMLIIEATALLLRK